MDLTDLTKYPITLLTDIQNVFNALRAKAEHNKEYVRITFDKDAKIIIEDLNFQSGFFFSIEKPRIDKQIVYTVKYKPSNRSSIKEHIIDGMPDQTRIIKVFENWINMLVAYRKISIHPTNKVIKNYQQQIYNSFQFLDEDGNDEPLDIKKQIQLSQFLTSVIDDVEKEDEIDKTLVDELRELNKNIPQLTQGQIKNGLSWTLAKMYFKGIDIINRIANDGVSAGIGYLLIENVKKHFLGM